LPHTTRSRSATVGEGANIGAGTIFANYDGVNKHSSTIGSHVRTGSHNVFVAPITIGDGAYTGAGTVVRKDVPAGALAINVAPQRNMDCWVETNRQSLPGRSPSTWRLSGIWTAGWKPIVRTRQPHMQQQPRKLKNNRLQRRTATESRGCVRNQSFGAETARPRLRTSALG